MPSAILSGTAFLSMNDPNVPRPDPTPNRSTVRVFAVASSMLATLVAGVAGGYWLDQHFATKPLWTICLSFLGLAIGLYQVIREILR
jgi:F0F1-type ATP synthase assembly protein I